MISLKERWPNEDDFFANKVVSIFSPRIRKDLLTIKFPETIPTGSVYAFGDNGTGKTLHICMRMVSNIHRDTDRSKMAFISALELLYQLKDFEKSEELLTFYSEIPYLCIDDIGVEKVTDWAYQSLYMIINRRYEHNRVTYYSSNLDLQELGQRFGDMRIPSRIQATCEVIHFTGTDHRANK